LKIKTGSFTGNGAVTRAITGVGFQPIAVLLHGNSDEWPLFATDQMVSGHCLQFSGADLTNGIVSLDADGFTVGNGATVHNAANENAMPFQWVAFGAGGATDIKTGSYTGNNLVRNITGCGFDPNLVIIGPVQTSFELTWRTDGFPAGESAHVGNNFFGFQTNQITGFVTDGFSLGTSNEVNYSTGPTTYYYLALKTDNTYLQYGDYTGNGLDDQQKITLFDPTFVVLAGDDATDGYSQCKHTDMAAGISLNWKDSVDKANRIQNLSTGGGNYFEVGTDNTVNKNTVAYEWFALRDGTTAAGGVPRHSDYYRRRRAA